jgi:hypothetical protein
MDHRQDPLKSLDTVEELRFEAHFESEQVNKSTVAKAGIRANFRTTARALSRRKPSSAKDTAG